MIEEKYSILKYYNQSRFKFDEINVLKRNIFLEGVHFEIGGAFDRCARVLQFIQAAVNSLPEVESVRDSLATVLRITFAM